MNRYDTVLRSGRGDSVIKEIVLQSRIEFNVQAEADEASFQADAESDDDG